MTPMTNTFDNHSVGNSATERSANTVPPERLQELLADRIIFAPRPEHHAIDFSVTQPNPSFDFWDAAEQAEWESLCAAHAERVGALELQLELTAAAVLLAEASTLRGHAVAEAMPEELKNRLLKLAETLETPSHPARSSDQLRLAEKAKEKPTAVSKPSEAAKLTEPGKIPSPPDPNSDPKPGASLGTRTAPGRSETSTEIAAHTPARPATAMDSPTPAVYLLRYTVTWGGWVAAAAAVVFALLPTLLNPRPSPEALRARLLTQADDVIVLSWTSLPASGGVRKPPVTGEVIWSDKHQQGVMTFHNLPANDPSVEQYQLWIFDAKRPMEHPVDGGVFDIRMPGPGQSDAEIVVPIHAKILVRKAAWFAVTIEPPGGVVVSDRSRIAVIAQPEKPVSLRR